MHLVIWYVVTTFLNLKSRSIYYKYFLVNLHIWFSTWCICGMVFEANPDYDWNFLLPSCSTSRNHILNQQLVSRSYIISWQEVAVKKFMKQDISGDALSQFKCEVNANFLTYGVTCDALHARKVFWSSLLLLIDAGWNHVKVKTSKCCSFHGSSDAASEYVHTDRISSQVWFLI